MHFFAKYTPKIQVMPSNTLVGEDMGSYLRHTLRQTKGGMLVIHYRIYRHAANHLSFEQYGVSVGWPLILDHPQHHAPCNLCTHTSKKSRLRQ